MRRASSGYLPLEVQGAAACSNCRHPCLWAHLARLAVQVEVDKPTGLKLGESKNPNGGLLVKVGGLRSSFHAQWQGLLAANTCLVPGACWLVERGLTGAGFLRQRGQGRHPGGRHDYLHELILWR